MTGQAATGRIAELESLLPAGRLITDPALVDSYRRDETRLVPPGTPLAVVRAGSTADVAATLRWANSHAVPVVPRGGGTSLAGGATAVDGCIVLSLASMTAIREISAPERLAVAEAGVINADLDAAVSAHGLMYAPDPASYQISTIGGNIATNAGGLRCVKYGVTRDAVLGLEVVLADGRVVRTGRRTLKGVTGYDLTSLFVGSEGTLGVVTAATLRLRPRPAVTPVTVAATFPTFASAAQGCSEVVRSGLAPSLLEVLDSVTLRAIDDWKHIGLDADAAAMVIAQSDVDRPDEPAEAMAGCFREAGADFVAVSSDPAESAELLGVRRLAYPATERLGATLVEDVCVPTSALAEMVERIEDVGRRHEVLIATVGHAGDGNLHPVFVFDRAGGDVPPAVWDAADEVFRAALDLGGTLTGEHGVGALKRRWLSLELGPESMDLHRTIKTALDPRGILNPGKAIG